MHSTYKQLFLSVKLIKLRSDLAQIKPSIQKYKHNNFNKLNLTLKAANFF
ncbi:hypothetical protein HORM4_180005 [Vibrio harveyi]|nr:hypothetical protein HORM4_180005 [Vibrio harveyi]